MKMNDKAFESQKCTQGRDPQNLKLEVWNALWCYSNFYFLGTHSEI